MYNSKGERVWKVIRDIYGRERHRVGGELPETDCQIRFQGQYEDYETGLYYNRNRYYMPDEGMYSQRDPIGIPGRNPSLYGYVWDSTREVDIFGLDCIDQGINIIDDFESIVDDIININKKYDIGLEKNTSIASIVNSASYYDDLYEQVAAISRSISQHAFENGNKRTAVDTIKMLTSKMNLENNLTDDQIWKLVFDMNTRNGLSDITEIAKILRGK